MKKILFLLLLGVSFMKADWLDELIQTVPHAGSDSASLSGVMEKYITQDAQHIADLEKQIRENQEGGFWSTLRGGTLQAELVTTKSQLGYHQKVAKSLAELPENKKERERLMSGLKDLHKNQEELISLRQHYAQAKDLSNKIKLGAQIAAKEVELNGRRTVIKGLFFF